MLEVQHLYAKAHGGYCILEDLSFSAAAGQCLCIIGESGSGKTTTLLSLMGLFDGALTGKILLDGRDLRTLTEREWCQVRGKTMGMVFQNPRLCLNPVRKVGRQIEDAIAVHEPLPRPVRKERTLRLLDRVALENPKQLYDYYPHMLSGGMGQRVGTAIAIACNPQIVLADEPTSALDPTLHRQIIALFASLKEQGVALIIATHQKKVVDALADTVAVLHAGKLVELGDAKQVLQNPQHTYTQSIVKDF